MNNSLFYLLFSVLFVFNYEVSAQRKKVHKRMAEMKPTRIEDHAYYVRIYKRQSSSNGRYQYETSCGGSLIASDKVLTNEQCLKITPEFRVSSVPGLADLSQLNYTKRYPSKKFHFGEGLAVIVLTEHVTINSKIKVIKMSSAPPAVNSRMLNVGYRRFECTDSNKENTCKSLHISEYELKYIYDEEFEYELQKSSTDCIGEVGGALAIKGVQYGVHLSGVTSCSETSFGINVADKEVKRFLSKYATYA